MSRRDLFRMTGLRPSGNKAPPADTKSDQASGGTTMPPDLPAVEHCMTTIENAVSLLDEIQQAASATEVRVRTSSRARSLSGTISLAEGQTLLQEGDASSMQVRYLYGDQEWMDTITITSKGVRVVRISHSQTTGWSERPLEPHQVPPTHR